VNEQQHDNFIRMTTAPVGRLICRLAVPTIISMMITAAYNMVDTFFVGQLHSNSATGAVGVAFSLMAIFQATGFFFGHGSGNYISMELGRQNTENAAKMAATGVAYALLAGSVILVLGEIFLTPLARLLGSTETILPYAKDYLRIILIGAPYITASFVLNNQLRFQGSAAYGMVGIVAGAVLNVGLDPLFMFVFGMGISGAALATIISQFASFCLLLVMCTRGGNLSIRLRNVQFHWRWFIQICKGGLPSLCRQSLMSVATICLNNAAGVYGDAAIAAMSVVQRAMMMANSALIGFGQGFQPVCGFNHGAKRFDRVIRGYWFCVRWATVFLLIASAAIFAFAPQIIAVFRDDPAVIEFGTVAMRAQCCTFFLCGFNMVSSMMTQTINKVAQASVLAVARQGLFFIPVVLILPRLMGPLGIQLAQSISDACAFLLTIPLTAAVLKELKYLEKEAESGR
jgi:putative MATE family efflux protein